MKDYVDQFYNEGLATTFYLRPLKYVNNVIKNKLLLKLVCVIIKVVYTILVLIFAWYMFWDKYPL